MKEEIKNRFKELGKKTCIIGKSICKIGDNMNGNHKRTLREVNEQIKNLEEVKENIEESRKKQKTSTTMKSIYIGIMCVILLFGGVIASINYNINGVNKLSIQENTSYFTNDVNFLENTLTGVKDINGTSQINLIAEGFNYQKVGLPIPRFAGDKGTTFTGAVMNNDNRDGLQNYALNNFNNGREAVSGATLINSLNQTLPEGVYFGSEQFAGFESEKFTPKPYLIMINSYDSEILSLQRKAYGFQWWINSLNDSSELNMTKKMELKPNGDLNVTGNITGNTIFGEIWFDSETPSITTIASANTWANLTGINESNLNGFNKVGNTLVCQVTGEYLTNYNIEFEDGTTNKYVSRIAINEQGASTKLISHDQIALATYIGDLGEEGTIRCNQGDSVYIQVKNLNTATDMEVYHASLSMRWMGH